MEEYNLLVKYHQHAGYFQAKREIESIMQKIGDRKAVVDFMGVQGLMGVKTAIDNRQVIREVRDIFASNPLDINSTFEWIPVDNWIGLSSVKSCVREIKSQIMSEETWCLSLEFFGSSVDAEPLRKELFDCVPNQVSEERPDKILRVLVIKDQVAVSILKNENSFVIENG